MVNPQDSLRLSRRSLLKAGGATAVTSGTIAGPVAGLAGALFPVEAQLKELEAKGWSRHPLACCMCGAYCGLIAMKKDGEPVSEKTVRIFPNPDHPQRGYCGRAASTMWIWNHPLRLKKPLKRVGKRGEGKFEEVSWDEALTDIAARMKAVVDKYGEASVCATSHSFSGFSKWLTAPLGSPNNISHSATCNSAGISARDWVFGKSFKGAGKMEPDYANLRYLILIGRSMGSSMGALHTLNLARERGAKVIAVDPRMPDIAYGDAHWAPIRPGQVGAFALALLNVLMTEKLADFEFLAHHTNAAYLIKADGEPLTQADVEAQGSKALYGVHDTKRNTIVWQGVKTDEKGAAVGFVESPETVPNLTYDGDVTLTDGTSVPVTTVYALLAKEASAFTPGQASKVTGIAADEIVRIARDFANFKGVIDDGWYTSKNGNDVNNYRLFNILNAFVGNIDRKGGLVVTAGAGFKRPGVSDGKGPDGQKWAMAKEKRIDKIVTPETSGNFWVALEAVLSGKPYPIRAVFCVGSTLFHRESNSARLQKALESLDLFVVQDVLPHEVCDWADYVLPATYYPERRETAGVKWALDGSAHLSEAVLTPPQGCEARHDVWILLEILRRAYPDRAKERAGYTECKTAEEFAKWWDAFDDRGIEAFIKAQEAKKPGAGEKIRRDFAERGWTTVKKKVYDEYPYKKPFATPTGKVELYGFKTFSKPGYDKVPAQCTYQTVPAWTAPKPQSNEFVLVSGKNCTSCSGLNLFAAPTRFTGDRTLWMNPTDARRLGVENRSEVWVEGVDVAYKAKVTVTVTKKVIAGSVFAFGFSGGVRTKTLVNDPRFAFVKEGINSHWYAKGYAEPLTGGLANNAAVRITPIKA